MFTRSYSSPPPVLAYYSNFVINCCLSTDPELHIPALEFVTLALVRFLFAAEHGVVGFSRYEPRMGQGGCKVLVPLAGCELRRVDHYGFASFFLGCALD